MDIFLKHESGYSVVVESLTMGDIIVRIGDLFLGLIVPGQKSCKTKNNSDVQKFVTKQFKEITGMEVPHRDFRSIVQTFVTKVKKNNCRIELDKLLSDWFNGSVSFKVEVLSVKNLGFTTKIRVLARFLHLTRNLKSVATKTGN